MKDSRAKSAVQIVLLVLVSLVWAFPLLWAVWAAIRPGRMVTSFSLTPVFSLENFQSVFEIMPFFQYAANSVLFVVGILTVQIITVTMAAYALARLNFRGKGAVIPLVMAQNIIPSEVLLLSNYLTLRDLNLLNTRLGVMVVSFASAMGILLLRQSYKSIPMALEEAAILDGCSIPQMLRYIYIPSCKTAYLSFAIVSINFHWNNFLWPMIVINSPEKRSLPLGLALLTKSSADAGPQWAAVAAATLLILLPLLVIFLLFQKQFIRSFVTSGLK